jgi:exopolyphosphatase / guanosine-5'-triphosphate,3'-diphosphate pyrophosphatase
VSVATSSTFRRLARLTGAAPRRDGPFVRRGLSRCDLDQLLQTLARLPAAKRARLPGLSRAKATQILARAIVAGTAMKALIIVHVDLSPWALREGIMLQRLDHMTEDDALHASALITAAAHRSTSSGDERQDHPPPLAVQRTV